MRSDQREEKPLILAVDDAAENLHMLVSLLGDDYRVRVAKSGEKAIELAGQLPHPDLILMDVVMPGISGFEACEKLKSDEHTKNIPIIFLTALNDVADETMGLEKGGADFIVKPINPGIVKARINVHLALQAERRKADSLLRVLLPEVVINDLIVKGSHKPEIHEHVSILFCDFINFSGITTKLTPEFLIAELTDIYGNFDEICEKHGATRIKTIGDAYMAASGLEGDAGHAEKIVNAGFEFISFLKKRNENAPQQWECRVGIHSGSVISGIIGKTRFSYDIIGVDVNIASRVESAGKNMAVTVTEATRRLLRNERFAMQSIGGVNLKGTGELELFLVELNPNYLSGR